MKKMFLNPSKPRKAFAGLVLASLAVSPAAFANFLYTDAGPYEYNNANNWSSQTIDNNFSLNLTAHQIITFDANRTLDSTLRLTNGSLFNQSFVGSGGNRSITLNKITLFASASNANKVTMGSSVDGQKLDLVMASAELLLEVGSNRTLEVVNNISGSGKITKDLAGVLRLSGTANTYSGITQINNAGVLEVAKLANGGQSSSIGTNSTSSSITFGGASAATLRYIGAGDSTDRRFLIGGAGAKFDASGSGAINFTSASTTISAGADRTITLTGTNAGLNTMAAAFGNAGSGVVTLAKEGTGKWVLGGANTYTGNTNINAGTLVLASTGSINNSDAVVIDSDATFDTTAKSFVMLSGQEFAFTLDATAGGSAGRLVAGALNITAGVVNFNVIGTLDDSVYILADYTSLTGTQFQSVSAPTGYNIDYAYNGGTQIALIAVPEPTAAVLLLGGLSVVLGFRRTRRKLS
jgi:fibronectin-binding autotransporter adhesin